MSQILAVAVTTAALCGLAAVAMVAVHRRRERAHTAKTAVPAVPAADDNVRGQDAEAFGVCHAIYHSGTAKRRNTRGIR